MSEDENGGFELGPEQESYIDELVRSGRYQTRQAALREGVRLLELRERRKAELDAALALGLADVKAGRLVPLEEVAARLTKKYSDMAEERGE